jgi:hypothetical protein
MENSTLYQQKVTLLSRLVKENAVTFEEALLLLKTDDLAKLDPPKIGTATTDTVKEFIPPYESIIMPMSFSTLTVDSDSYRFYVPISGTISTTNDSIFTINSAADLNT